MNILRQLFGKKHVPETFETKLQNLETQPQSTLEAVAKGASGDPADIEIRKEALKRLPYTVVLRDVMQAGPASLEKTAREQVANLLSDEKVSVKQLLQDFREAEALLAIAALCNHDELQAAALEGISDEKTLAELCEKSNSASVRQTLAERIHDVALLRGLQKALKGKDKNAYKIVKAKVDAAKAEEEEAQRMQMELDAVLGEMDAHAKRVVDKDYASRLHRLERRWAEVQAQADEAQKARFAAAQAACAEQEKAKEAEREAREQLETNLSEADNNRKNLIESLWRVTNDVLASTLFDDARKASVEQALTEHREAWNSLKSFGAVKATQQKQYTYVTEALENLKLQCIEGGTLLERFAQAKASGDELDWGNVRRIRSMIKPFDNTSGFATAEIIGEVKSFLQEIEAREKVQREERQKRIRMLGGLIRKSSTAVERGRLKQAIGIRHSIDEKLPEIDDLPAGMQTQLENLDEAIQKLIDWQAYAVVPKKQQLVESMRELVGADLPPEALATKIKNLQSEWKSLSQSGKDRKEDLWQEFSELADKAFEPCKEFFQDMADVRQQNLAKRQELVDQLKTYLAQNDWQNADWKQVEKILRTARQEIHGHAPVDRAANKPVMEAFDAAMAEIQAKLEAEFDKNKAAKQQIIAQAEKLLEQSDLPSAIEAAKRFQSQWKAIGRCAYKDNESLWKEFRRHCDAVFAKRDEEATAQKAELDNNQAVAQAFIDKVETLARLEDDALLAARAERDQIQQDFYDVGPLHSKVERAVKRSFQQALENFDAAVKKSLNAADMQAWQAFFACVESSNNYWRAQLDGSAEAQEGLDDVQAQVDAVVRWPEGGLATIKSKLSDAPEADEDANARALRLLCIRAEILADVESPQEDKSERMGYQVELLQKGLSGQALAAENTGAQLALEWASVGPAAEAQYQLLFNRFHALLEKLL